MMKVKFVDVGRNKACFEAECDGDVNYEWLYTQVKPYLMSDMIEFTFDGEVGFIIVGGFRHVGGFEIIK